MKYKRSRDEVCVVLSLTWEVEPSPAPWTVTEGFYTVPRGCCCCCCCWGREGGREGEWLLACARVHVVTIIVLVCTDSCFSPHATCHQHRVRSSNRTVLLLLLLSNLAVTRIAGKKWHSWQRISNSEPFLCYCQEVERSNFNLNKLLGSSTTNLFLYFILIL